MPKAILNFANTYLAAIVVIVLLSGVTIVGMDSYMMSISPTKSVELIDGTIRSVHFYGRSGSYDYLVAFGSETAFINDKEMRRIGSSVTVLRKTHIGERVSYELAP